MKADLDTLRSWIGTVSNVSNTELAAVLEVATDEIRAEVMATHFDLPGVQLAIIMRSNRFLKRRWSPEGVAGWGELGVIRISARDPDEDRLLAAHRDWTKAGVA